MSGSLWPLQQAIYTALSADTALGAAVTGIYDNVEQDYQDYPYVTIGEIIQTPFDQDLKPGDVNVFAIHVWSRPQPPYAGKEEAYIVSGYIYDILNRNLLSVTGYTTVDCIAEDSTVVQDPDGETYHGINTFRATLVEQ